MALFKCKMCGGTLEIDPGRSVVTCEYCGTQQTLPKLDDEKRSNLYDRANHFRRNNEYDKAMALYEQILNEDNSDAEAYWSIVLCRYGIEYVEDPSTKRRIPTVNRAQFTSIFADEDYKAAISHADSYQRSIYELEAKAIDEIQKGILAISSKEEPFDVFICYKETDKSGKRTQDSVLAQELYYGLKNEGFKVFFARITLEDKLGSAYEPYIFAALNSAKVMVVLGTKTEHFNAVWVKNEWSRYLSLMKTGKKTLIPAYKDMDPYDLPDEFSHLQAQDMSKLGFMQDLIRGIKKIAGNEKKETVKETVVINQNAADRDTAPLLKRAALFLEDGDWNSANEYVEKVLDIEPECSEAYLIKLMIDLKVHSLSQLPMCPNPIASNPNYVKALRFAKGDKRNEIENYNKAIVDRIDLEQKNRQYSTACSLMSVCKYDEAISAFSKIKTFKDSSERIETCLKKKENDRKDTILAEALRTVASTSADDKALKKSIAMLQPIKGYKNVDEVIERLETRLAKWYEDKRIADEQARIKAEQARLEAQRQAELREIKTQRAKRKAKKVAMIGVPSLIAFVLIIVLLITLIIPAIRLSIADKKFKAGEYDEAQNIYAELDGFGGSEKRISVINAIEQIESGYFTIAIRYLLDADVPVELTYDCEGGSVELNSANATGSSIIRSMSYSENGIERLSTDDTSNQTIIYKESSDFSGLKTPIRYGYAFEKWVLGNYSYDVDKKNPNFCLVLSAIWKENMYSISYELNGGSISGSNPTRFTPEDESFVLINPTRVGYTFAGWVGTDLSSPTLELEIAKGSYGDKHYIATWTPNQYTITFDADGGTIESQTQTVTYDKFEILPTPQKRGYTFLGWYVEGTKYESGVWKTTNDLTLKALWQITAYNITYVLNGGNNNSSNPVWYNVKSEDITLKDPIRTGYTFLGWTFDGQSTPIKDVTIKSGSVGDIEFTANWQANTYTITLDANGGEVESSTITVTYDSFYSLPIPVKKGHNFDGWFYGWYVNNIEYSSGIWTGTEDITLIAKWSLIHYSISYVLNGGSNSTENPTSYTIIDDFFLKDPTREGYTFEGWTFDGQDYPTKEVYVSVGTTEELEFTAHWRANTYVITLDANGGEVESNTITVTFDSFYSLPIPTRKGYDFDAWFLNKVRYSSGIWTIADDVTLTANWSLKYYSISYVLNGGFNSNDNPTSYTIIDDFFLKDPTRDGYTFEGWTYDGQTSPTREAHVSLGTTEELEFTAHWRANTYVITLDANGGTVEPTTINVTYDSEFTLPNPERVGYKFAGWYNHSSQIVSWIWKIASNVTFTAKWTPRTDIPYVVNHHLENADDDGYTLQKSQSFFGTADSSITPQVLSYAGFTSPQRQTVNISPDGSLVVDYFYKRLTYTVTFVSNGGSEILRKSIKYQATINLPEPTRERYTFGGWFEDTMLSIAFTTAKMQPNNITLYAWWAEENKPSDFSYTTSSSGITITGYSGFGNSLGIPAYIGGVAVTSIKGASMQNITTITKLIIPDTVTSFGLGLFKGCNALEEITLPHVGMSETEGNYYQRVFGYIFGYTENSGNDRINQCSNYYYYIPKTIKKVTVTRQTTIPYCAFKNCDFIEHITIPEGVTSIGESAFENCSSLLTLNSEIDGLFNIPLDVTMIGEDTFYACKQMKTVTVGKYINQIGNYAFGDCTALSQFNSNIVSQIVIPNGVASIGNYAFRNVTLITKLIVPDTVTSIGLGTFKGCNALEEITLPHVGMSETGGNYYQRVFGYIFGYTENSGNDRINQCSNYYYYIPKTIKKVTVTRQTTIPDYAFQNCDFIEHITIPEGVTSIGKYAFYNCSSLLTLNSEANGLFNIPLGVTTINEYTFNNCVKMSQLNSLTPNEMVIPNGVTSIGYYAFQNVGAVTKLLVPDTVKQISNGTFKGCNALEEITLPHVGMSETGGNSEQSVFGYIFGYDRNSGDAKVNQYSDFYYYIPKTIKKVTVTRQTTIPYCAFKNCDFIEHITIPEGVTSIGEYVFYNCSSLLTLNSETDGLFNLPSRVTVINQFAFYGCAKAEAITSGSMLKEIGYCSFYGCTNLSKFNSENTNEINIPYGVETISGYAFANAGWIKNIIVSNSVTTIGRFAFNGCNALEEITLPHVGMSETGGNSEQSVFGYIFGYDRNSGDAKVNQYSDFYYYIPKTIKKVTVTRQTAIPYCAFKNCDFIEHITIPEGVTSIGEYAFYNCSSLLTLNSETNGLFNIPLGVTTIAVYTFNNCVKMSQLNSFTPNEMVIPNGVTSIGNYAFQNVGTIKKIIVPDTVTSLGLGLFKGCNAIEEITLPHVGVSETANNSYQRVFGYIFGYTSSSGNDRIKQCSDYYYIPKTIKKVTVTRQTTIPNYAFQNCDFIEHITIPEGVTSIGESAFENCSSLLTLNSEIDGLFNIPLGVIAIKYSTFNGCTLLSDVSLFDDATIVSNAFEKTALANKIGVIYLGSILYKYNGTMPNGYVLNIKEGTTSIYADAFNGCTGLSEVIFPDSLKKIGTNAFNNCIAIQSATIKNLETLGDYAFYKCTSLQNITLNNVKTIGKYALSLCSSLVDVKIPKIESIGAYAFSGSSNVLRVNSDEDGVLNLPKSCINIEEQAFARLSSIHTVNMAGVAENIGAGLFAGMSSLEKLTLGRLPYSATFGWFFGTSSYTNGVATKQNSTTYYVPKGLKEVIVENVKDEKINAYTFTNCTYIESIVFNCKITSVGDYAFSGSSALKELNLPNVVSIGNRSFDGCTALQKILLGTSVESIGSYAFQNCSSLQKIYLPKMVTFIGEYVFNGCKNITIYCEATQTPSGWDYNWNPSGCTVVWSYLK